MSITVYLIVDYRLKDLLASFETDCLLLSALVQIEVTVLSFMNRVTYSMNVSSIIIE